MSLFHELRRRPAKVLFVGLGKSGHRLLAEALTRVDTFDVMNAASVAIARRTLDLAAFDVIVNLSACPIPRQEGTYMLTLPVPEEPHQDALERIEQIVEFLAKHFRWAREWNSRVGFQAGADLPGSAGRVSTVQDEWRTTPAPRLILVPRPVAARTASI
jgi:hypothetical protein